MDEDAMDGVAPDGSPVEVYLALPAEPDLTRVLSVLSASSSVLDLGSGPGRIANQLAASGHDVVAVDDSPAMLARIVGAETVLGDVWTLDLGRRFDAVLALSHLIDSPTRSQRIDLLRVCRRHLDEAGIVVVQRYAPEWIPEEGVATIGDVTAQLHDVVHHTNGTFDAAVTYTVGERSWTQTFSASVVDDEELAFVAAEASLRVINVIGGDDRWVLLGAV